MTDNRKIAENLLKHEFGMSQDRSVYNAFESNEICDMVLNVIEAKMNQLSLMAKDLGGLMGEQSILENRIKEVNRIRLRREIEIAQLKNDEF